MARTLRVGDPDPRRAISRMPHRPATSALISRNPRRVYFADEDLDVTGSAVPGIRPHRAADRMRRSAVLRIALIYLGARVVTTGFLLLASAFSPPGSRFGPGAGLGTYVLAWDAQWYQRIAREGYPAVLPLTDAGDVAHNAWAFMPLYPWLAAAVGTIVGSWAVGAVIITLVAGFACCLVLRAILVGSIGEPAALWAVAFFASGPLGALFQVAYPETLFLLLILLGIRCLQRRRYGALYALVPAMAFLRPGVLAFALLLVLFGVSRWVARRSEPPRRGEYAHLAALAALAGALGFSWPVIAARVTGRADAYLQTELSWRRLWMGDEGGFVPFEGWFQAADYWFRQWGLDPLWSSVAVAHSSSSGRQPCWPSSRTSAGWVWKSGCGPRAIWCICSRCSFRNRASCVCCCRSRRCGARWRSRAVCSGGWAC